MKHEVAQKLELLESTLKNTLMSMDLNIINQDNIKSLYPAVHRIVRETSNQYDVTVEFNKSKIVIFGTVQLDDGLQYFDIAAPIAAITTDAILFRFAGVLLVVSSLLAYFVNPVWVVVPMFVGTMQTIYGFTGFCPAKMIIDKIRN